MKAHYRTENGRLTFEVEAATPKDLFGHLATLQEVFEESQCGLCGSTSLRFVVRESEGKKNGKTQTYTYYELRCRGYINGTSGPDGDAIPCRGRFEFGQSLDTENLFPKRKDADGNWMANGGWYRYTPKSGRHDDETGDRSDRREPERQAETENKPDAGSDRNGSPAGSGGGTSKIGEGAKTPDGLQPSFDRLGDLLTVAAPTRTGPALDLIRAALERKAGSAGVAKFDKVYREHTGQSPAWSSDAAAIKRLLAAQVEVLRDFEVIR